MNQELYDIFISYKHQDSAAFSEKLKDVLTKKSYDVWIDTTEILPGDSILSSIERGISSSLCAILVISKNYFTGWSEYERRTLFNLATSKNINLIPIWHDIDISVIRNSSPMFLDISAIAFNSTRDNISDLIYKISLAVRPADKRRKLFEFYFECLYKTYPDDPDLKLFIAVGRNDSHLLDEAIDMGANLLTTDNDLLKKYFKSSSKCGCIEQFRKLYLHINKK